MKAPLLILLCLLITACSGTGTTHGPGEGDTLQLEHAQRLTIVRCNGYTQVTLADPWNEGRVLHTYLLVPADGDVPPHLPKGTIVRTPLRRSVIATSVHCGLLQSFGKEKSIGGVCDVQYIHLPFVEQGCKDGSIADCGSALAPAVEKVLDLQPDAIFLSPFQNSGGYGRVEEIGIPIIEMAEYMETSPLGRAEWMRFYGLLFGAETQADSIFRQVEADYEALRDQAAKATSQCTVLMDKMTGSVWYVPGGNSTIGHVIADAHCGYAWADDTHSGSLSLPFETVLEKAAQADVWLFRFNADHPISPTELLSEHRGYDQFRAFQTGRLYGCNTATSTFYEETPFHPERLLRDFVTIAHPELGLGEPKYFLRLKEQ